MPCSPAFSHNDKQYDLSLTIRGGPEIRLICRGNSGEIPIGKNHNALPNSWRHRCSGGVFACDALAEIDACSQPNAHRSSRPALPIGLSILSSKLVLLLVRPILGADFNYSEYAKASAPRQLCQTMFFDRCDLGGVHLQPSGPIACLDAAYSDVSASAACVLFSAWSAGTPLRTLTSRQGAPAAYELLGNRGLGLMRAGLISR